MTDNKSSQSLREELAELFLQHKYVFYFTVINNTVSEYEREYADKILQLIVKRIDKRIEFYNNTSTPDDKVFTTLIVLVINILRELKEELTKQ